METKVGGKDGGGLAEPFCAPPAAAQDTRCVGKEKEGFLQSVLANSTTEGPRLGLGGHHCCSGLNRSCLLVPSHL